jgi:hypothetical protein
MQPRNTIPRFSNVPLMAIVVWCIASTDALGGIPSLFGHRMFKCLVVVIGVLPLSFLLLIVNREWIAAMRRPTSGICSNCGYDLRATPNRCPECGRMPEKREIASG